MTILTQEYDPAERLAHCKTRIEAAAKFADRDARDITLIAVSKSFGPDRIRPIIDAGQRAFGENRVQEAQAKWPTLKDETSEIALHLIGPLQRNKARDAVLLFDAIHSLDRVNLAEALAAAIAKTGRNPTLFMQVNTGEEPQKAGIFPVEAEALFRQCIDEFGLTIAGLMCIPPADQEPSPHFALLRQIARDLGLKHLSMGMSADFECAVKLGATHVRIGSAIFGTRAPHI
jgi:pyridoxal phosphate enzyme (YggS family)